MSAPEEVLAVIDAAIAGMEGPVRERRGHRDRLIDARAVVVELIERERLLLGALQKLVYRDGNAWRTGIIGDSDVTDIVGAFLPRVQGGAQ